LSSLRLPDHVEAVCANGSITYLVDVGTGVVAMDAGFDDEARAIKKGLRGRRLLALLIGHAHLDHMAGTAALDVPTYVGRRDAPALRGDMPFHALAPVMGHLAVGSPIAMGPILPVDDGDELVIGSGRFRALAALGHTPGSIIWLFNDVAFSSDAIVTAGDGELYVAPEIYSDDIWVGHDSMRKLLYTANIRWLADGHRGVMAAPQAALRRGVERQHHPDRIHDFPLVFPIGCTADEP
jgi:glyoxylase-like metal-dependent hydrolase (beta-lactamase superfamily II)